MFRTKKLEKLIAVTPHYDTNLSIGLTKEQVKERKKQGLINKVVKRVTKSYLRIFYENVVNAWNILLFAIAALMIYAKLPINRFAFLVVLGFNILVGLYQDIRARKLIDKMKVLNYPTVWVLRDGKMQEITANHLVLSDLVEIKAGNQIVCDGTLVDGSIEVNESLLTGEPDNINKTPGSQIYSGSYATVGKGLYRVDQLGKANYAEKLQSKARKFKKAKSEIIRSIKGIFKAIGGIVFTLAIALFFIKYQQGQLPILNLDNDEAFKSFQTTADSISGSLVAMVPIGMYLLTTITLAVGVIRLANKQMLTQDMYCIETLARADILCLDKTGTLTDGRMSVKDLIPVAKVSQKDLGKMLFTLVDSTKDENPTANAIRDNFGTLNKFDIVGSVPFSSERKYSAVLLEDGRNVVLGAREFIPHNNKTVDKKCEDNEAHGYRVLVIGLAEKINEDKTLENVNIIGVLVLEDHIRDDAKANIDWFKKSGVGVRIITGDNPDAAAEIARRAGIDGANKSISLEGLTLEEVRHIARDFIVFGRVSPEQKEVIIQALKDDGHVVAMTGDGVNDILALRVADCSIAMASGSDAAKNVSHLVSLDSNFSALPSVVKEGRRVINNLQRAVSIYLVKTVFAIFLTVLFLLWGLVDKKVEYPFTTDNMLIWEMLNIGVGSLFLSLQPNEEQIHSSFMANIMAKVLPAAFLQIFYVLLFYLLYKVFGVFTLVEATSLSILAFSIGSFIILVRICMPFDAYRALLVVGLGFVDAMVLFSDFHSGFKFFGIEYSILNARNSYILASIVAGSIVIYALLEKLSKWLHSKFDKRKEEAKYENF